MSPTSDPGLRANAAILERPCEIADLNVVIGNGKGLDGLAAVNDGLPGRHRTQIPPAGASAPDNRFRRIGTSRRDNRLQMGRAQRSLENHYEEAVHEQSDNPPASAPAGICHRSGGSRDAA